MATIVIKLDPKADKDKVMDAIRMSDRVKSVSIADKPEYENTISDHPVSAVNEPDIATLTAKSRSLKAGKNSSHKDVQKGIKDMKEGKVKPVNELFK